MTYTVSITSQGQISIPAKIRKLLGFSKKKKAIISIHNGKMVIEPVKDLLELGGSLKSNKKPLLTQELHDFFTQSMVEEYRKNK